MKSIFLIIIAILLVVILSPFVILYRLVKDNLTTDYLFNIAVNIDQLGGTILYNEKDWTVSSWTYHLSLTNRKAYYFMRVINFLFGKDHCYKAWVWECKINQSNVQEGM